MAKKTLAHFKRARVSVQSGTSHREAGAILSHDWGFDCCE